MIDTLARLIDEAPETVSTAAPTPGLTRSGAVHIDGKVIIPMVSGDRPLGLYAVDGDGVQWYPVVNARHRLGLTAAAAGLAALATVAILGRSRRRSTVET
jgi:hypothetical protein